MTSEEFKAYLERRQARIDERAKKRSSGVIDDFIQKNNSRDIIHEMVPQKGKRKKIKKRRGKKICGNK